MFPTCDRNQNHCTERHVEHRTLVRLRSAQRYTEGDYLVLCLRPASFSRGLHINAEDGVDLSGLLPGHTQKAVVFTQAFSSVRLLTQITK
jgi:hypothetical protein